MDKQKVDELFSKLEYAILQRELALAKRMGQMYGILCDTDRPAQDYQRAYREYQKIYAELHKEIEQ